MALTKKQIETIVKRASEGLSQYCMKWNIQATVTGVSGGLDSAVTLALAKRSSEIAFQKGYELKTIGLILPCHSDPRHTILGKKVIKTFRAELLEIDLTGIFDIIEKNILRPVSKELTEYALNADFGMRYRTAQGNIKARIRMALGTYYVANMVGGVVLSTDNYSEYWMGFWTLHGDVGDFGMIQELWKGNELIQVAEFLGVPDTIIQAAPTDGLGILPGGDTAQLGAPYLIVDRVLKSLIKKGIDLNGPLHQLKKLPSIPGIDPSLVKKIAERSLRNSFKRKNPIILTRSELDL